MLKIKKKEALKAEVSVATPTRSSPGTRLTHTRTSAAARPARSSQKGATLAWLGGPRSERGEARFTARAPAGGRLPWRDEPRGRHGRGSPGPRNVLSAAAAAPLAGPSGRERGGGGSAGRLPHRALPAGGKTRPGSPRLERDSPPPPPPPHPRPRAATGATRWRWRRGWPQAAPRKARVAAVPPRLPRGSRGRRVRLVTPGII